MNNDRLEGLLSNLAYWRNTLDKARERGSDSLESSWNIRDAEERVARYEHAVEVEKTLALI